MATAWAGATPVQADDGATQLYELGVDWTVVEDITITAVRVWHGAASNTVAGRSARFWTTGGGEIDVVDLDDALAPGWTEYPLDAPLERTAGAQFVLSYSTRQYYGATPGNFPAASADGAVLLTGGRFRDGSTALFPNTASATFYGVDLVYTVGIGGNTPPAVTLAATVAGLEVTATVQVVDEAPGSVTYVYDWGDGTTTSSSATSASHTYAGHGLYAVSVVATDAAGAKGFDAVPVVARPAGGGLVVEDVMTQLAAALDTIEGLTVHTAAPDKVVVPAAVVAYPDTITFDTTYQRGSDTLDIPVVVLVRRITPRGSFEELGDYAAGVGLRSVKATLEGGVYSAFDDVHVRDCTFDDATFAGVRYLTAVFGCTVVG